MQFRIIFSIIFMILSLVLEALVPFGRYGRRRRRRSYMNYWNDFDDYDDFMSPMGYRTGPTLADRVRAIIRRNRAKGKAKQFLTVTKYVLTLKNKQVILVYDTKNKTISCVDNVRKGRACTIVWAEQADSILETPDNRFARIFDDVCFSFDDSANYAGILKLLKDNFNVVHETEPPKPKAKPINHQKQVAQIESVELTQKLDINTATEEEFAKLPGISIIIAKKIIKYRDLHGGFRTMEEFFEEMKIKPHFQKQLARLITLELFKQKNDDNSSNERIIDL